MIPQTCIRIESKKFTVMDGEESELVNEGMYGKALGLYLKESLPDAGVNTGSLVCEDWGWWLDVQLEELKMGLCIHCDPDADGNPETYAILPSIQTPKIWSWKKLSKQDRSTSVLNIVDRIVTIFESDPEVARVSRHDDYMF